MATIHLPHFTIDEVNAENKIAVLMKHVEPSWEPKDLHIKKMALGNLSCHLFRCEWNLDPRVSYVIRLFDEKTMTPMKDHQFEVKVLEILVKRHCFPRLAVVFANGICYEYMEGVPFYVNPENFEEPSSLTVLLTEEKLKLIAEKLADIHNIIVPDENFNQSPFFDNLLAVFDQLYPQQETEYPSKESLQAVVEELRTGVEKRHLRKVLCHGDLQLTNILWIENKGGVQFVDWEMVHIGYQAYDIAYFLMKFIILEDIHRVELHLPEDYFRKFLRFYLKCWNGLQNLPETEPNDKQINDLHGEVDIFIVIIKLFHIGVSVPAVRNLPVIPDEYKAYILQWWDFVIKNKEKVFCE